jgi:hypothetical protein
VPTNVWRRPATGWMPAVTAQPMSQDSSKVTKSGCHLTWSRGKSPELQPSWEGPYKVITWSNDVVCSIQWHPWEKRMAIELNCNVSRRYLGRAAMRRGGIASLCLHTSLISSRLFQKMHGWCQQNSRKATCL